MTPHNVCCHTFTLPGLHIIHEYFSMVFIISNKINKKSLKFHTVVQVWEMETGQFVYQVTDAHGPSTEITAMTVDSSGYRLATGAYNG